MTDEAGLFRILDEMDRIIRDHAAGELRRALAEPRERMVQAIAALGARAQLAGLADHLARLFARESGPREFCRAALEAIAPALRASRAYVVTFAGPDEAWADAAALEATILAEVGERPPEAQGEGHGLSRSLLTELVAKAQTLLISDMREGPHGGQTSVARLRLRSVLIAPLFIHGRVGGAACLENATLAGAFTEADKEPLAAVARILGACLQVGTRLDAVSEERTRLSTLLAGDAQRAGGIVGESPAIRALVATIERLRTSDAPVLVQGESGTGKELVARALHFSGRRAAGPLVTVNCAAIPEGLMESELLGHERGAFTGATDRKKGKFEQAHRGTLFLDEVGELRLDLQAKLLRVLQEQAFERVGGAETIKVDVRVVAATNRDLRELAAEGKFREDLFYRLHVVPLEVPPLRARAEDILPLAEHFLAQLGQEAGRSMSLAPDAAAALRRHAFPGNVRELRNLIQRLVALAPGERITEADLPAEVSGVQTVSLDKDPLRSFLREDATTADELRELRTRMQETFDDYVRRMEVRFYESVLERSGDNVSEAARLAGLNRTALHRKLKELGLR